MKNFKNTFMNIIMSIFFSFSFIHSIIQITVMKSSYSSLYVFIVVSIFTSIYAIILRDKRSEKVSASAFFLISLGLFLYFIKNQQTFKVIESYINGEATPTIEHQKYIFFGIAIVISLLVYIFTARKFNFYFLLIVGGTLFSILWINKFFIKSSFYLYVFLILLSYFKHIYIRSIPKDKRSSSEVPASFLLSALPICLVIFIFAYMIPPLSNEDIKWKWMDLKIKSAHSYVRTKLNINTTKPFNLSSTGFNPKGSKLGGDTDLDNTLVMSVESPRGGIYLKGAVRDTYTGYSWETSDSELTNLGEVNTLLSFNEDLLELSEGSKLILDGPIFLDQLFDKVPIKITYENLQTNTIFVPSKTEELNFGDKNTRVFVDNYGVVSSDILLDRRFEYMVNLYDINKNREQLDYLGSKSTRDLYVQYLTGTKRSENYIMGSASEWNIKKFAGISQETYDRYIKLPDSIPDRVRSLASEITSKPKNDYDKVKAIESYLSQNYKYTLKPGSVPQGSDFVDYFLFDKKVGYCTYFASAMTILTRSVGLPARYVEGYVLPNSPTYGTTYQVTNNRAHAWVEVYFKGLGWIPFEPTAAFSQSLSQETVANPINNPVENRENQPERSESSSSTNNNLREEKEEETQTVNKNSDPKNLGWKVGSAIFLILALWIVGFSPIKRRYYMDKLKKLTTEEQVIEFYDYFLKALSVQGLKLEPGETPLKYSMRVVENSNLSEFNSITYIFIKARYSNTSVDEKELKFIIDFYNKFPHYSRERMGVFKYFLYSKILGVI